MLITLVPINTVCFLLSVGSSDGTKPFSGFECQHLLPLVSTFSCVCVSVCSCVDSVSYLLLLCLLFFFDGVMLLIIIGRVSVVLFFASLWGFFRCVYIVMCFVLCCRAERASLFALLADGLRLSCEPHTTC